MRNANMLMSVLLLSAVSVSPVYAWSSARPSYSWNWMGIGTLIPMEGRTIYGVAGAELGYVLAVDVHESLVQVQTPDGVGVALPARVISSRSGQLRAPALSPQDMMAIAKQQTGRTVAINAATRHTGG